MHHAYAFQERYLLVVFIRQCRGREVDPVVAERDRGAPRAVRVRRQALKRRAVAAVLDE